MRRLGPLCESATAWCFLQDEVAIVRVGPFLYGVDVRSSLNRRLLEFFDLGYDGDRETLLKFPQGALHYNTNDALLASLVHPSTSWRTCSRFTGTTF